MSWTQPSLTVSEVFADSTCGSRSQDTLAEQLTVVITCNLLAVRLPAVVGNSSCCLLSLAVMGGQQLQLPTPYQACLAVRSVIS